MNNKLDLKQVLDQYAIGNDNDQDENFLTNILADSKYYDVEEMITFVKSLHTENQQFKILHLNIQSLSAKFEKLKLLLSHLEEQDIVLDVVLLCETFLHEGNMHLFKLPGYNLICKNRTHMKGGGVAIYVRSNIAYSLRDDISVFVEGEFETVFIETFANNKKTVIGEIYRIPGTNLNTSLEYFENLLNKLKHEKQIILGTDQNFDLLRLEDHPQTANLFNLFLENSFLPTISKPTRITAHSGTLIDNIYLNNLSTNMDYRTGILLDNISDHLPIFCIITNKTHKKDNKAYTTIERRHITAEKIQLLNSELSKINWDYLQNMQINDAYENFTEKLINILDRIAPKVQRKIKSCKLIRDPWMTKVLMQFSKRISKLYRKSLGKAKTDQTYTTYIQQRNAYNQQKREVKQNYFKNLLQTYRNNAKLTWRTINSIINKETKTDSVVQMFKVGNQILSDPKDISNGFCNFFAGVGKKYAEKVPPAIHTADRYLNKHRQPNNRSIFFTPTDTIEISDIIHKMKPKQSSGHDELTPHLVIQLAGELSQPISMLINMSIQSSVVPNCLKLSKVVPIYKSKNKDDFANYRPVSLLPVISKILEKVIYKRLVTFLDNSNMLNNRQFGFRKCHSTIDAVTKFIIDAGKFLDDKESILAVFCDLSCAFDTIDHGILLRKLQFMEFKDNASNGSKVT